MSLWEGPAQCKKVRHLFMVKIIVLFSGIEFWVLFIFASWTAKVFMQFFPAIFYLLTHLHQKFLSTEEKKLSWNHVTFLFSFSSLSYSFLVCLVTLYLYFCLFSYFHSYSFPNRFFLSLFVKRWHILRHILSIFLLYKHSN